MIDSAIATIDDFSRTSSHSELLNIKYASVKVVALAITLQEIAFRMLLVLDSFCMILNFERQRSLFYMK